MNRLMGAMLCGVLALATAAADAQVNVRVRGTEVGTDGGRIQVSTDGVRPPQ